ncbi:unnamed protein product [Hermetia illucens]|uniref:Mediator of RNA polymerase II transcription subunit 1 n=1 Tax=Hermetia illucens TaxID=343691 RepID=A0A7R8YR12_HERIL|nr:mediator of RNA polymerase II transcription subunit 1-like [Hermetia illucens]CAD7081015.1 unnamed protein product [Hermetia illucens]
MNTKSNEMVGPLGSADKNKQWQRELLMERLRTHSAQNKSFAELSKAMRMSMLEKRYSLDPTERGTLQKCLDSMQHCIKVTTRQGLIERLESLSRQLGLKFMEDTSGLFISSDMFYLEIVLDAAGTLSDVKVHHECKIEQQSCSELVTCLLKGDFADFTTQLEGLSSIYQLNAEPKVKSKAFVALQAMEMDLYNLYAAQNFHKDAQVTLLESSVGIVQKRRGGHPMKLTYFVSPYDLLNLETKSMAPLTIDIISTQNIGMSVTVNLEASNPNKLQISPTVTLNADAQGASIPVFSPITPTNSTVLPATFVLRLNKPIPVCDSLLDAIVATTQQSLSEPDGRTSIMELVVQTASNGALRNGSKGLFITLPDQNHCYFFTENKRLKGSAISSIPYTEPSQVPKVLTMLRQQALFYTLLASCVREDSKMGDLENTTMLEVSAINNHQISVALEHPFEESMATVEFNLKDASNIDCHIYSLTNNYDAIAIKMTKIIQKTLSIPITIRALLKFWDQEQMKGFHRGGNGIDNGNFSLPLGPSDPGGRMNDFRDIKPKNERGLNGNFGGGNRQFFHASAVMMGGPTQAFDNNVHMFDPGSDGAMMNQFGMKTSLDGNFIESKDCAGGEDFYKNPKSRTDNLMNQNLSENSDSSSLGTSTPTSDLGVASNINMRKGFHIESDSSSPFIDGESSRTSLNDNLIEMTQKTSPMLDKSTLPEEWRLKSSSVDSNVSILPVTSTGLELNSVLSGMGLERRPGIEIIPITATTTQSLPTSITITPITSSSKGDRKSSSSKKYDDKSRSEKKRKRRKEDSSSMGPPDKMLSKQDSLNRGVSVSIKTADGSSVSSELLKKISSSGSKLSSGSLGRPSPKNSPSHISPKHISGSTNSPKPGHYNTSSPKHTSSGSSGKPSMSALKSATNSSPKSEKGSSKSSSSRDKDRDRDRERSGGSKSSTGSNSPKLKSSAVKLKQIDLSAALLPTCDQFSFDEATEGHISGGGGNSLGGSSDLGKPLISPGGSANAANKARKGSLSAVIDKLKSAQNTGEELVVNSGQLHAEPGHFSSINMREKIGAGSGGKLLYNSTVNHSVKTTLAGAGALQASSLQSNQNSEYMIKPSLDGMKITINKTRTKDSPSSAGSNSSNSKGGSTSTPGSFSKIFSTSGGGSGSGSPKRHTGLKPGVNSGPASKKSQSGQSFSKLNLGSQSYPNIPGRGNFQKSSSSGSLSSSTSSKSSYSSSKSLSSSSLSNAADSLKKDKAKNRTDASDVMKMLGFASPMEGFMKSLNTKFQIPKLSARTNDDSKKSDPSRVNSSSTVLSSTTAVSTVATTTPPSVAQIVTSPPKCSTTVAPATTVANEGSKPFSDIFSKDMQSKYPFSVSKLPMEPAGQSGNATLNNATFNKVSSFYNPNPNPPKYPQDVQNRNTKSPLSHISITNSIAQKDFSQKTLPPAAPISTSAAPIQIISPPYTPTNCPITKPSVFPTSQAGVEMSAATTIPVTSRQSDESVMRPPSAPCTTALDMSRSASSELDLSVKAEASKPVPAPQRPSSVEAVSLASGSPNSAAPSAIRKVNSTALVPQHKMGFPASPSVSVHIVKSPVPSPLMVLPSPHSNSPCITDDELMDEALVGIGGK